jgi:nicotinate-nucleotide adenylyltransferase
MRIGFFGGSFDPPHRGHIAFALEAANAFALDQVLLAPVGTQPLKEQSATGFLHRYAMTALAAQADERLLPSLLDAPGGNAQAEAQPNYTVDTLERLRALLHLTGEPVELFTLLGADSLLSLRQWREPERMLALCDWIVATRPGYALGVTLADALIAAQKALPASVRAVVVADARHGSCLRLHHAGDRATHLWLLPEFYEDVSASGLRVALASGDCDPALLPESIADYIRKTGLYAAAEWSGVL